MTTQAQSAAIPKSSFWAVTLLISGTCIGAGMLALPVQTAEAGFSLSFLAIIICWAFMTYTGMLLIEATSWVKNETHFSSLSRVLLGKGARLISMVVYLFMNYCSLIAYTAGGSALICNFAQATLGLTISYPMGCVLFTLIFGLVIFLGAVFIGKINFLFMIGLVLSYLVLVNFGIGSVQPSLLSFRPAWGAGFGILSMILATFSYQMVIPSLCYQLDYDTKKLKKALLIGTTIPFVIYTLWLLVIHGIVPLDGDGGLRDAFARGASATEPLGAHMKSRALSAIADFFAFFALVTSYFGLSLALFSFLKDCFNEMKINVSRSTIIYASLLPTLALAILFPRALLTFFDLSGAYGDTILSGLLPVAMVWVGRYKKGLSGDSPVFGGKALLALAASFYFFIILLQWI